MVTARPVRYVAGVALIAIGYDVFAQGGEALLLTGPAGAFWPATGVGIAVLYLGGLRWWPGVLLGDLLSRECVDSCPSAPRWRNPPATSRRALVAAIILRRLIGPRAGMDRLAHVGAVLLAVGTGEAISATVAMVALRAGEVIDGSEMAVFWRSWWLGGVAGGLVVVPLALAWAQPLAPAWRGRGLVEGALMIAAVGGSERDCAVRRTAADLPRVPFADLGRAALRPAGGDARCGGGRRGGRPGDVQRARTVRRTGGERQRAQPSAVHRLRSAHHAVPRGDRLRAQARRPGAVGVSHAHRGRARAGAPPAGGRAARQRAEPHLRAAGQAERWHRNGPGIRRRSSPRRSGN